MAAPLEFEVPVDVSLKCTEFKPFKLAGGCIPYPHCGSTKQKNPHMRGFWAATLATMGETNVFNGRKFNGWSESGPGGRAQPDGILKQDGFGQQACMALLDNFFNDGLKWHDTKCNDRRHIVCEDLPVGNINFEIGRASCRERV